MATKIKEVQQRRATYDWSQWQNGRAWRALKGVDFDCEPKGFAHTLYSRAYLDGMKVRVSIDGDAVEFQFYQATKK